MTKVNIIDVVITSEKSRAIVRKMIPILVRWAKNGLTEKTYGDINHALGYEKFSGIGHQLYNTQEVLKALSKQSGISIPTLNSLAKNRKTLLPSEGFEYIEPKYNTLSEEGKRKFVRGLDSEATSFDKWDWVLKELDLKPAIIFTELELNALRKPLHNQGGEGKEHKAIKEFVYKHPESIGIQRVLKKEMEYDLASGDRLDVYFETKDGRHIAVEVKPSSSPEQDTFRGLFQCIKYKAVMDAYRVIDNGGYDNETLFVIAGKLPDLQKVLADDLKVNYIENFKAK